MMEILIIILALLIVWLCVFMKGMTELDKRIVEIEKKIDNTQHQLDDILCDIKIVNQNVRYNYGLLSRMKDELLTNK